MKIDKDMKGLSSPIQKEEKRERWSSRLVFIFAAVGSAIGLGNVWRFPYLVHQYGGGSFLIPYVFMLFLVGIPLLCMELAFGQKMQFGPVRAYGSIAPYLRPIGILSICGGFLLACYYCVIMAWILKYVVYSLKLAWGDHPKEFFFQKVLQVTPAIDYPSEIVYGILIALVFSWIFVYFSIWKGIKGVGKIVLLTMPLPIILLLILFIRMIFLPGAWSGIQTYFRFDLSILCDLEVWFMAASQVFFTLTLGHGVMLVYGSYKETKSDITKSVCITALLNSSISFIAGLVVFSTLGHMAFQSNVSIDQVAVKGISLAFVSFPKALSLLPYPSFFAFLFFIMLFTLAIDSAFSLVEAFASFFYDRYPHFPKAIIVFFICFFGFLGGIIFTTRSGIYFLEIFDHFLMSYGIILSGLSQSLVIGWVYGAKKLRLYINDVSDWSIGPWWDILIKYLIPSLLLFLFLSVLKKDISGFKDFPQKFVLTFGWSVVGFILSCLLTCILGWIFSKIFSSRKLSS